MANDRYDEAAGIPYDEDDEENLEDWDDDTDWSDGEWDWEPHDFRYDEDE